MTTNRVVATLLGLALITTTACALDDDDDGGEPDVSSTSIALSTSNWSPRAAVGNSQESEYGAAMAALDGTMYMVHGGNESPENLWWTKLVNGHWVEDIQIPNQYSGGRVQLAAFNGYLYLFHVGESSIHDIWVSRFSPATQTWSTNFRLGFQSKGAPALAVYNGLLHMAGVNPSTKQVFTATMTAGELFSVPVAVPGQFSESRPALAVFNARLVMAHRAGSANALVISSLTGTTWSAPTALPVNAYEASLASFEGNLHLVAKTSDYLVSWTYSADGTSFALPVTIGTLPTFTQPSLATYPVGLVVQTTGGGPRDYLYTSTYLAAPVLPPRK